MTSELNLVTRSDVLRSVAESDADLIVVGGGIVGCGVAVDAAARGLSVVLLERDDFGSGASSHSSKLIHGGLRYLEQLDFGLVHEALRERAVLLRTAPHLVRPLRFVYPLRDGRLRSSYVHAGLALYDVLGSRRRLLPKHRRLGKTELGQLAPSLDPDLGGGYEFWDATVDDARLTIALARTAADLGARLASRVEVTGIRRGAGKITVVAVDRLSGEGLALSARRVVCAVGAETEHLQGLIHASGAIRIAPSKGAHIVVAGGRLRLSAAVVTRTAESILFVIPWNGRWIVGTTDTPWSDPSRRPEVTPADVDYLLTELNRILAVPLRTSDVIGGYAGVRPLVASAGATSTTRLSREHAVVRLDDGLVLVAGGKLTTYRVMARDAVDAAFSDTGVRRSSTHELPLLGWQAAETRSSESRAARLEMRYGSLAAQVLDAGRESPGLLEPIPGAGDYLAAEALYAVTHEGALDLDDVLSRRLRVSFEVPDGGSRAAEFLAPLIAPALGWDSSRVELELERYRSLSRSSADSTTRSAKSTVRSSIMPAS